MDAARIVRWGGLAGAVVLVMVLAWPSSPPSSAPSPAAASVTTTDGSPVTPQGTGLVQAVWNGYQVYVFFAPRAQMDAVDQDRGMGSATPHIDVPGFPDTVAFAFTGRAPYNGCGIGFLTTIGGSKDIADYNANGRLDGRLLESCWQGQYDPWNHGKALPGTPAVRTDRPSELPQLHLEWKGGQLFGSGFTGDVTPPRLDPRWGQIPISLNP